MLGLSWSKKKEKESAKPLQNDNLQLKENAVVTWNIYEEGFLKARVGQSRRPLQCHPIKAFGSNLPFIVKVKNKVLGLIILRRGTSGFICMQESQLKHRFQPISFRLPSRMVTCTSRVLNTT
jgi:hypothetical protein